MLGEAFKARTERVDSVASVPSSVAEFDGVSLTGGRRAGRVDPGRRLLKIIGDVQVIPPRVFSGDIPTSGSNPMDHVEAIVGDVSPDGNNDDTKFKDWNVAGRKRF